MASLAAENPGWAIPAMGLHPSSVGENWESEMSAIENRLADGSISGVRAVGETGLDYHWDTTYKTQQQACFRRQIELSLAHHLPIILHTRSSFADTLAIVCEFAPSGLKGVFHCFGGTIEEAQQALNLGFYLGIGGIVTFKNSGLSKVLPTVPLNRILLETDAPYLAPAPHRGKRNDPSMIPLIAAKVAEIYGTTVEEVAKTTTANTKRLFGLT